MATLTEADAASIAGRAIVFGVENKVKGKVTFVEIGTTATDVNGIAQLEVPSKYVSNVRTAIRATFGGDGSFLASSANAFAYRT